MAENVGAIYYTVEADTAKLLSGGKSAGAALESLNKKAAQTDMRMKKTSAAIQGLGRSADGAATSLKGLLPILSGAFLVKTAQDIIRTADAWTELQNRLRLVTKSQNELNKATEAVFRIAQTTSSEIGAVAQVYQRFAQNAKALGISLEDAAKLTETVSKAVAISGASAASADAALTQFGQALASGTLRGEELNSILEQTPGLANAIAEGIGVTVGELRQLGADGKITTDVLIKGLNNVADSVDTKFQTRVKTAGQAWTELQNSVMRYIGEANTAAGITTSLADAISSVSAAIDSANVDDLVKEIDAIKETIDIVMDGVQALVDQFKIQFPEAAKELESGFSGTENSIRGMLLSTAKEVDGIVKVFQGAAGAVSAIWDALAHNIPTFFSNAWIKIKGEAADFVNDLADLINTPLNAVGLDGIGKVSFGQDELKQTVSLTEAAKEGWENAAKGVGAYDEVLRRLTEREERRAAAQKEAEKNSAASSGSSGGAGGNSGGQKKSSEEAKRLAAAQKEAARAAEQNRAAIDRMAQALYFAGLQGEALAVAQARASLNEFATPEQVANLEAMARALYQVQQVEQQRQKFGQGQKADEYIMGSVSPLSGGAFDEQYARYEAEAQVEQERYAAQLERLQQARELQIETSRTYDQLEEDAARQHADRMAQIEQAKNSVMLSSASDAFGAMADIMRQSQGEQSGIYRAMFAASKAFAIADATVNAYSAVSKAWNSAPFPANLAAVAATTPQVMSVVSAISGASYSGRQYGGSVAPGKGYRINENGAPEILNTASGRQYLLPNSRGEVVSNKDATANESNGVSVVVNVHNAPPGTQVKQQRFDKELILDVMIEDVATGGRFTEAGSSMLGWRRQGR
ncbi:tape measure protein [Pseudomonas sp. S 311-6]|nr:tape measure protein [Pseudomonas sp. S 311-6]